MNRDELVEASALGDPLRKERNRRALLDLITEGATHILMKDGTAVPLDGGEAVEGVVVLQPVAVGKLLDADRTQVFPFVPGRITKQVDYYVRIVPMHEDDDADPDYNNDWDETETVYVPLNTPSKPNQEASRYDHMESEDYVVPYYRNTTTPGDDH